MTCSTASGAGSLALFSPKPHLIQGLGFNFDQENTESESGYTSAYELEASVLLNHEYNEAAGELLQFEGNSP